MEPLRNVAYSYIEDVSPFVSSTAKDAALDVLLLMLKNEISVDEATELIRDLIGSLEPVEKISAILNMTEKPIPFKDRKDSQRKNGRRRTNNWTLYEDQRLLAGIHKYGFDNWSRIADFVGNGRTRAQCSQRWNRGLDPTILKGPWTEEEEIKLLRLLEVHGCRAWKTIAAQMERRSDVQCRYHYTQILKGKNVSKDYQIIINDDQPNNESKIRILINNLVAPCNENDSLHHDNNNQNNLNNQINQDHCYNDSDQNHDNNEEEEDFVILFSNDDESSSSNYNCPQQQQCNMMENNQNESNCVKVVKCEPHQATSMEQQNHDDALHIFDDLITEHFNLFSFDGEEMANYYHDIFYQPTVNYSSQFF
ncbi:Myb-like DNA-binding domain containing protein [Tritrichomonas foetus]|uniref:Myb-like DNA-binding domain containing protein n=1 Tax=Tritrichomonas foetus TaxID=1144522 RepID=A0A1J4J3Q4_9EUKA|nr:Myb-like DNA-binding domain containing protein [Tritrichomonas foetus]|eukprot:OHS94088.1 Myb-like DNA-binding domain containing protein [Tritrichomonas foetus]